MSIQGKPRTRIPLPTEDEIEIEIEIEIAEGMEEEGEDPFLAVLEEEETEAVVWTHQGKEGFRVGINSKGLA